MLQLNELSNLGFGGYRLYDDHLNHEAALRLALDQGCNLIDTSSTYTKGSSERLIGRVLQATGLRDRTYLVSKAGYVNAFVKASFEKAEDSELRQLVLSHSHSIDPLYLDYQLSNSLERMQTHQIDAYLLHNPEYLFTLENAPRSEEQFYGEIETAFRYLEEQVQSGRIRHYGLSCNTLPLAPQSANPVWLLRLLEIAQSISKDHHFRWIQFPYNLTEDLAKSQLHQNGQSLLELAAANRLRTMGNRPLNAQLEKGWVRLADYGMVVQDLISLEEGNALADQLIEGIQQHVNEVAPGEDVTALPGVMKLRTGWHNNYSDTAVRKHFRDWLGQLLNYLYQGEIDPQIQQMADQLYHHALAYCKKHLDARFKSFVKERGLEDLMTAQEGYSPSSRFIQSYLTDGPNHVLLGMREPQYVRDVAHLL